MAHDEASGGPVLPPQRRGLQQRFDPHARVRDRRGTVRRLLALYARWGGELLLIVCLTLLSTGTALAVPYLPGQTVGCFLPWDGMERAALSVLLPTPAGAAAAQWLGNWDRRRWMETLSQRMVACTQRECFAKLGRLLLSYSSRRPHRDTMDRLVSDADNASTVAAETVTRLLSSLLTATGALAIMTAFSPLFTLTALTIVPVIALCTHLISRRSRTLYRQQADELGRLSSLVQESLSNSRTVKLYRQQEELLARFSQMNGTLRATSVEAQVYVGLLSPLVNMVNNLSFALITCAGGTLVLRDTASVGLVVSFLGYSRRLERPLNSITALFSNIQQAVTGAGRLFEILDESELSPGVLSAVSPRTVRGEVSFVDVSFSYEPDRPVLEHVSFYVRAGEVAAFVGETDAGKTTLANLLTRIYGPTAGEIRLDGVPLGRYSREGLNRCFSVVLQETVFFHGMVLGNLRYARPEAMEAEVICATKLAHAHGFIQRLSQGHQTLMSGVAGEFSQGQYQLLAMARAPVSRAPILILDETTSSADTTTEQWLQQAALRLLEGRTCFLIAHRLPTIRRTDRIFVVGERGVVEFSTCNELMKERGIYWSVLQ